jgi:hypothetical protein
MTTHSQNRSWKTTQHSPHSVGMTMPSLETHCAALGAYHLGQDPPAAEPAERT